MYDVRKISPINWNFILDFCDVNLSLDKYLHTIFSYKIFFTFLMNNFNIPIWIAVTSNFEVEIHQTCVWDWNMDWNMLVIIRYEYIWDRIYIWSAHFNEYSEYRCLQNSVNGQFWNRIGWIHQQSISQTSMSDAWMDPKCELKIAS